LVPADGDHVGTLGASDLDVFALERAREALWTENGGLVEAGGGVTLFIDAVAPPPRLIIVGAIDFAAQLAEVAKLTGWRPFVVDPRARFATAERFLTAERVIVAWPAEAFAQLGPIDPATAIACSLTTRSSTTLRSRRRSPLTLLHWGDGQSRRPGASPGEDDGGGLRPLYAGADRGAIGLDLGALTSAETALSIMSEIVAIKHGRMGGRLISAGGRIHDAAVA